MLKRNRSADYQGTQKQFADLSAETSTPNKFGFQKSNQDLNLKQQTFENFLDNARKKIFKELFKLSRGRNNPISYNSNYDFLQQWEAQNKENDAHLINFQMPDNFFGLSINLVFLIEKILIVWFLSIYRLFAIYYQQMEWMFIVGIIFILTNFSWKFRIIMEHYKNFKNENQSIFENVKLFQIAISEFYSDIFCLIYFGFTFFSSKSNQQFLGLIILDYMTAYFQYSRGQQLFKKIKLYGIRSAFKNYIKLIDLMSNLFIIIHFMAILIYSVTLCNERNWIDTILAHPEGWYSRYIYSFYFTCTTMLSVGYGDILPTNKLEIITILLIQISGTATNGYIFSEVGHILSKIRQKKQTQEKDISDTQKLSKVYKLDKELGQKMTKYIVNNQMDNEQLNIEQQNKLLHKLNDELRTEVTNYNNMQIIKENIFFLFHFSKKVQVQFAKRLERKLFSPNENIYQISGKEKLFIVFKGKLQIYTDRKQGMRFYCKKKLKDITKVDSKQIADYIFGYSSILFGRPTNLRAVTKEFSVIYNLDKSIIMQVLNDDANDFEGFCQLRDKILIQKYPERWEVPRITSIRQHYSPTIFFLLKKQKKQQRMMVNKQRIQYVRSGMKNKRIQPVRILDHILDDSINDSEEESQLSVGQIDSNKQYQSISNCMDQKDRKQKYQRLQNDNFVHLKKINPRSYKRKYLNNKKYEEKHRQQLIEKWQNCRLQENLTFDCFKNFTNYFKKRNLGEILVKLVKKNEMIERKITKIEGLKQLRNNFL